MKKFLMLILICFVQNIFAQDSSNKTSSKNTEEIPYLPISEVVREDENQVYNTAGLEVKPEFPGGLEGFNKFIEQNFKLPSEKPDVKGKVYVTFIVEKNGSLSDIKALRDIGYNTGKEAIRVLKSSPKWSPGKQNDKLVRVLFSAPILVNIPAK